MHFKNREQIKTVKPIYAAFMSALSITVWASRNSSRQGKARATSRCFNDALADLCHSNFGRAEIRQDKAKQARSPKAYSHTSRATSRCFNAVLRNLSKQKKSGYRQTPHIYKFCEEKFRKTRQSEQTK